MRAALLTRFGGPDAVEIRDVPPPVPQTGQALVRVTAAGMNNTDIWTRQGAYGAPGDPQARAGWRGPVAFPRIQGGDIAGVVESTGPGTDPALRGRRVLVDPALYADDQDPHALPVGLLGSEADGGFAEYVAVRTDRLHDVTGSPLGDDELAALPVAYGTAMGMLDRAAAGAGDTVLVTGASGGVGHAALQLAAAAGCRVIAVTSRSKHRRVLEAGAALALDRDEGPDALGERLHDTAPGGVAAVLDVVGGDWISHLLPHVADGGRWVTAGAMAGYRTAFDLRRLYVHNVALIGSSMHTAAQFAQLADAARKGTVRPLIHERFPLSRLHEAQARFEERRHVGKIVLDPTG
ncbi:zinc-binding dehydrogenase [Streptomyces nanshensis]|uniref:Zn-dependent oxidoreductase n=1 Tax=Streptomyces nanshensis TaxID=518642 RepID=A0A1E7KH31_9ACTN|nr:zinc-binding dehydrogenase [Streptomyces nanshensis]OEV03239.1 Zn-dependent oxidoreductase [Streptomyces nanshensis]